MPKPFSFGNKTLTGQEKYQSKQQPSNERTNEPTERQTSEITYPFVFVLPPALNHPCLRKYIHCSLSLEIVHVRGCMCVVIVVSPLNHILFTLREKHINFVWKLKLFLNNLHRFTSIIKSYPSYGE